MAPRNSLKIATLAAACLAVASGCSTRQKTAGETMLDAPRQPNTAVAQAPAPEPAPAPVPAPVPAPAVAVSAVIAPPAATPAAVTGVTATGPAGLTKTGSGTLTITSSSNLVTGTATMITPVNLAPGADQAALLRGWNPVVTHYQNGNVIAGPAYRLSPPPAASNRQVDTTAVDLYATVLAVPQFFATPIWMCFTPPLTEVQVHGEEFPPSYTLDDPIDTSREKSLGMIKLTRD